MTRRPKKPAPKQRRATTKPPAPTLIPAKITYHRNRDGDIIVKRDGRDAGELRPSASVKGAYYGSVYSDQGYMLSREELRQPIELGALKVRVERFLSPTVS